MALRKLLDIIGTPPLKEFYQDPCSILDLVRDSWEKFILKTCQSLKKEGGGRALQKSPSRPRPGWLFFFRIRVLQRQGAKRGQLCWVNGTFAAPWCNNLAWWCFSSASPGIDGANHCWRGGALSVQVWVLVLCKYQLLPPVLSKYLDPSIHLQMT